MSEGRAATGRSPAEGLACQVTTGHAYQGMQVRLSPPTEPHQAGRKSSVLLACTVFPVKPPILKPITSLFLQHRLAAR